ncbi:endonuclease/exonuclease/phosphatase family protein [Nocardioides marmorisolisilvae]|uniref:Endonuclease/exonuclease/phosphatase family protein n=1 Tax=Nocardioides marmorisolisilvae TaxID=1542737 RepID=A0A3N0DWG2_9ACTN|nr:endonuclease/exonuclease/phosphatase family protein [Nocardioides marmorisolisilvae]RNL79949.1 endonuclease/exonuclease/phosphatase family protein [Nocardioides marmorisolisilvae]
MLATSFAPYALPGFLVAALGFGLLRPGTEPALRRWLAVVVAGSVLGAGFHAALLVPAYAGEHATGRPDLVVMNLNLRKGHADAEKAVALARREHAQLVVLEEVTPGELSRLHAAGITTTLPYEAGSAGSGGSGTVVFSVYPLGQVARVPLQHDGYRIAVAAPEPFWLVAVHVAQPLVGPGNWRADWSVLNQVVPALTGRPVMLVGDFNSTLDHRPVRNLLADGFADAARAANSGWQPTWPSTGLGLIAIDHVLTRGGYRSISTSTFHVPGSDHRALVARLAR